MHALREYIQSQLDSRGWVAADLAKHSGISKQVLSGMLTDTRPTIDRMPLDSTVSGLARAFGVDRDVILAKVGEAMGLPTSRTVVVYEASRVPNDVLVQELRRRLREDVMGNAEHPAPMTTDRPDDESMEGAPPAPGDTPPPGEPGRGIGAVRPRLKAVPSRSHAAGERRTSPRRRSGDTRGE